MYAFEYVFYPDTRKVKLGKYTTELWSLGAEMMKGGQVSDFNILSGKNPKMVGFCHERGSLSRRRQSELTKKVYREMLAMSMSIPRIIIGGILADSDRICKCKQRRPIILETNFYTLESPITCGICRCPIPFYRLDLTEDNLLGVKIWNETYSRCDGLFIGSGVGEYWGYRQISSFSSALSQEAYKLCRDIEKTTHNPTYYFLSKYYGRSKNEEKKRRCPKCRGKWLLKTPWHGYYHFKCDRCRLLSNIAWDA